MSSRYLFANEAVGKAKRSTLAWWDVVLLSCILFGNAIVSSISAFVFTDPGSFSDNLVFDSADNWNAIGTTLLELLVAYVYLRVRRFDFSQWTYRVTWKGFAAAICAFVFLSLCMDLANVLFYGPHAAFANMGQGGYKALIDELDLSLVLFSLLNGFYEEIFFLGICTVVSRKAQIPIFLYSLVVRFSFHTYQGLFSALSIGLIVGCFYYVMYTRKSRNLFPWMMSHSLADIFGIGFIALL